MAGIYVHIPLCKSKCIYCDFYSVSARHDLMDCYVQSICKEADLRKDELRNETVKTVYIGGGTPSLLSHEQLILLVDGLRKIFDLSCVEEFTIEVNPDDVSAELVRLYVKLGVNRVSMGVQSFVDDELRFLNRRHDSAQAVKAYRLITDGGIDNVSIDLIYGIPGQTLQSWNNSVLKALQLMPKHISCYNLSYEDGTNIYRMLEKGMIREVGDEECVAMYESMTDMLGRHGYEHYEISNFALPSYYSRHNSSYWDKSCYLGLGASAHSYVGGVRFYNPNNIKSYVADISSGKVVAVAEAESKSEQYNEEVMIRLRTSRGVDASILGMTYGEPYHGYFLNAVQEFVDSGLVENKGSVYRLSRRGIMLSDMVIRELMYV